ncbi:hypothetical protein EDD15DRAFT_2192983 [Pisolithus albus]|nr:hypothetical protein EDD15DRAFT_2192983 [Pisolithus albus]
MSTRYCGQARSNAVEEAAVLWVARLNVMLLPAALATGPLECRATAFLAYGRPARMMCQCLSYLRRAPSSVIEKAAVLWVARLNVMLLPAALATGPLECRATAFLAYGRPARMMCQCLLYLRRAPSSVIEKAAVLWVARLNVTLLPAALATGPLECRATAFLAYGRPARMMCQCLSYLRRAPSSVIEKAAVLWVARLNVTLLPAALTTGPLECCSTACPAYGGPARVPCNCPQCLGWPHSTAVPLSAILLTGPRKC